MLMISILCIMMYFLTGNESMLLLATCITFGILILYVVNNLYDHVFLFCFLVCFFTFLLSGQILNKFMQVYHFNFSNEIEVHADICLLVSLVALIVGYYLTGKVSITIGKRKGTAWNYLSFDYDNSSYCNIRKISKTMYYCFFVFWMLTLLDVVLFVTQNGYTSYYISFKSRIPSIIRQIGYMAPTTLFIYLATMPSKKDAKVPLLLYVLYAFITLGTGRRINFITSLLIVFGYMLCRNVINPDEKKPWLSKKMIIVVVISIPVLLTTMYFYEYIRSTSVVGTASDYSPIVGFFVRQGTSINVIKYGEQFKNQLNQDARYSLYNTLQWLQNSPLNFIFGLDFSFGNQSMLTATNGTYLADFVSYHANASIYNMGMGYGSCYIEELYIDFGYVGVFIGNFIYGSLFKVLEKGIKRQNRVWRVALGLFILDLLFKAPRATFDAFFGKMLYFEVWGTFLIIYMITYLYGRNH